MISAVSGISFRGTQNADFQNLIQSEGKFSNPNAANNAATAPQAETIPADKPAKKGKAGKIIGGTLAAVVIAGLALFGLKRGNILKSNPEAEGFQKVLSKLADAGEWIGQKIVDPVLNIFKRNKAKDIEKTAEETAQSIFA